MRGVRFDWRWVVAIVVVVILANSRALPWPLVAGVLAGSGGYLLYLGWQVAGGSPGRENGRRVTYWRGQRIEREAPPPRIRMPSWREFGPAALYLVIGGALLLGALAIAARALRL